jgi:hypothetical protein
VRLAVRAHVQGALDFGGLSRYRPADRLRRSLVYDELDRETELAIRKAAFERLSWFIPVAENRREVADRANKMYRAYLDLLIGREGGPAAGPDYKAIWENYWGMKIGSPEQLEWERRFVMDRKLRRGGKGLVQ